jgi:hypothetical protein
MKTYPVPYFGNGTRTDGTPVFFLENGTTVTRDEWQQMRVTEDEYARLMAVKRKQREDSGAIWNEFTGYN